MDNRIIKKIISLLLLCSIFITGNELGKIGFTLGWFHFIYVPFSVLCLILYHRFSIKIAIVMILMSAWCLLTFQDGFPLVIKQLFNICFNVFVFYNFLRWENFNYEEIYREYIFLGKVVLVIGFFQVIIFALEPYGFPAHSFYYAVFPWEVSVSARFQSVAQEPTFLAYAFAPIVFLCLYNLFSSRTFILTRWWSVLFVLSYILTFSLVAYAGLFIMVLTIYFKDFSIQKLAVLLFVLAALGLLSFFAYLKVPEIKIRTDDTIYGVNRDITEPKVFKSVNLTTYVLLSNQWVTLKSLHDQPFLGSGLGTYELTYDRYLPGDMKAYCQLNREDSGSMLFRLVTETGIVGLLLFCFYLLHFRIRSRPGFTELQEFYWVINAGVFVLMLMFLIRSGNYTHQARMLFFLIYYYTYKGVQK